MKEVWKKIPGFENYEASNIGRIRSLDKMIPHNLWGANALRKGKILKSGKTISNCYLRVVLMVNENRITMLVHRLVALAWIKNPENKITVNHKNGIKTDNRVENLEWNTQSENVIHAFKNGLRKPLTGHQLNTAKLNIKQVHKIKSLRGKMSCFQIGEIFGVNKATIYDIMNNKTWKYV